jgi:hypothetical protein
MLLDRCINKRSPVRKAMCADGVYPGLLGEDVGIASNITAQAGEEKRALIPRPP